MSLSGKCKLLKIYVSEDSKYKSHNLAYTLLLKFKEIGMAGVTIYRGLEGYGKDKIVHTSKILELSASLPMIIEVVDTVENINKAIEVAKQMVNEGLIVTVDAEVIKDGKEVLGQEK